MGAGLDSSLPQLVWARESEKPPEFRVLTARRAARDWKGGRGGGALRGGAGDAALPAPAALQQAWAADKGLRRPRHASTHRAAPTPGIQNSAEPRSRCCRRRRRLEAGPEWGPGAAREPEGRGGLEKASGRERRPGAPRGGIGPAAAVWGQGLSPPAGQGTGPGPRP